MQKVKSLAAFEKSVIAMARQKNANLFIAVFLQYFQNSDRQKSTRI